MRQLTKTTRMLEGLVARARTLRWLMIALMGVVVIIDILKPSAYSRFPWDGIPGFTAAFAFFGALLLVGIYKALGFGLLYRREDYYNRDDDASSEEPGHE